MVSATLPFATNTNGQLANAAKVIGHVTRELPVCPLLLGGQLFAALLLA